MINLCLMFCFDPLCLSLQLLLMIGFHALDICLQLLDFPVELRVVLCGRLHAGRLHWRVLFRLLEHFNLRGQIVDLVEQALSLNLQFGIFLS